MVNDAHADKHRQKPRHGQAEAVEHRQEAECGVLAAHLERFHAGALIRDDIAVGQRHGLGCLLAAAGEQEHARLVWIGRERLEQQVLEPAAEPADREQSPEQFELAELAAELFQEEHLRSRHFHVNAVHERLRRDDMREPGELDGMGQVVGTGRPVEQDRQLAGQREPEEGEVAGHRSR
jgi:hypothetical protein